MRRILAAALVTLGSVQIAAADVSGHAFVGGYMRGYVSATGTPVHIAAYERLTDLATGAVGPRACVAFVEYGCAPIELRVHPTLLEATLSGTIPTDSGGSIEIDLTVETGTRISGTEIGVGDIRVPPAASVCNFVFPHCGSSTVGGGVNYYTAGLGMGVLRHYDAAGNLTHELKPHLCDCDNIITYGRGAGAAVLAG